MVKLSSPTVPRVFITGLGMVTPCGQDREASWQGLLRGQSMLRWLRIDELEHLDCRGEATRIAAAPAQFAKSTVNFRSNLLELIQIAAREAMQDVNWNVPSDPYRCGVVIGSSKGDLSGFRTSLPSRGDGEIVESWLDFWPNAAAQKVADLLAIRGPVIAPVGACATGLMSILRGVQLIEQGVCDTVVAGSVDDSISEMMWSSYRRLGVLARIETDPALACRPFDLKRSGFLMGSGAAVVVLENESSARTRQKLPYCEWLAGGLLSDATALTQVSRDATGLTYLIKNLLRQGNLRPEELGYIGLHGTGTRDNDRFETLGIRRALGKFADHVFCSSLKGTIGHLLGAAGSVEFVATVLALRDGLLPPTANLDQVDPDCRLKHVIGQPQTVSVQSSLKLSFGFGGHIAGALIRKVPETQAW